MATTYHACDMILIVYVDAPYLSRSMARSVVGCIFFMGNRNQPTRINDTISAISTIIPCIISSAGEAKYAALFTGGQYAAGLRTTLTLTDMGYPQPPTTILCDNTQHFSDLTSQRHHQAKAQQGHRHEVSLDSRSHPPKPIRHHNIHPYKRKHRRLHDKESAEGAS